MASAGRFLIDLIGGLQELNTAKVDLFLQQQAVDTTTPGDKAMFQMLGVFAEFERSMIQARVKAGMARIKAGAATKSGKPLGGPDIGVETEKRIRQHWRPGTSMLKTAQLVSVGSGTVQKVVRTMTLPVAVKSGGSTTP